MLEDGEVARDGLRDVVERLGVDAPEPQVQRDELVGVVGDRDALPQRRRQVLVHPLRLVDAIERGERRRILVVLAQHLDERVLGALEVAELGLEGRREAQQHVATDLRVDLGVAIGRGRRRHRLDVGVPLVRRAREAHELVERLLGRRILLDRLGPPPEGGDLIDELLLGDLGEAAQQRLPLVDVGDARELHLVDLVQLLPLLAPRGRAARGPRRSRAASCRP